MIPIPNDVFCYFAKQFDFEPHTLQKIGGGFEYSDGIVYASGNGPERRVLKITVSEINDSSAYFKASERARFFSYLDSQGVKAVDPIYNANGLLIEQYPMGEHLFMAYSCQYIPGKMLTPEKWTDDILKSWGMILGKMHRLTQDYHVFDGVTDPVTKNKTLDWREEIEFFTNWCKDTDVKKVWHSFKERIEKLPVTRQVYGMVQNDPTMENFLIYDNEIFLIDFDVSICHFFANDIAIVIQSALSMRTGGIERPLNDKSILKWFVSNLLNGYRQECDLPPETLDAIELFIAYRRTLMFTVMQESLKKQPQQYESWKQMVIEQPPILDSIL